MAFSLCVPPCPQVDLHVCVCLSFRFYPPPCLSLSGFPVHPPLYAWVFTWLSACLPVCLSVFLLICRTIKCVRVYACACVCTEWICMWASGVTLLSHAKASVEQIGLVGCRDSTHISLNKSAVLQPCVCVWVCASVWEWVCVFKQAARHAFSQKSFARLCMRVCEWVSVWVGLCVCVWVSAGLCVSATEHAMSCEVWGFVKRKTVILTV